MTKIDKMATMIWEARDNGDEAALAILEDCVSVLFKAHYVCEDTYEWLMDQFNEPDTFEEFDEDEVALEEFDEDEVFLEEFDEDEVFLEEFDDDELFEEFHEDDVIEVVPSREED